MTKNELVALIKRKKSALCVGLDTDPTKLPNELINEADGVFQFNKAIIEATLPWAAAYKLNVAFYESRGADGWLEMKRTIDLIPRREAFIIADAKRGDIGNTSQHYAAAFFDSLNCHAITVNPYMGTDSLKPFFEHPHGFTIALALTSNPGAADFELLTLADGSKLFERVLKTLAEAASADRLMFVVGATKPEFFKSIRRLVPHHFLLIPGVGAQGGDIASLRPLLTTEVGILVNASRQILYASSGADYARAAAAEAENLREQMSSFF